jgi:hypothetical protein
VKLLKVTADAVTSHLQVSLKPTDSESATVSKDISAHYEHIPNRVSLHFGDGSVSSSKNPRRKSAGGALGQCMEEACQDNSRLQA